jgi:hypothetical protein
MFSPLVGVPQPPQAGQSWSAFALERVARCNDSTVTCRSLARLAGEEKVTVPAGTFDSQKVVVEVHFSGAGISVWGEYVYWYAPAVRRFVKYQSRFSGADSRGALSSENNVDLELASYRLAGQAPVGSAPPAVATLRASAQPTVVASAAPVAGLVASGPAAPKPGDRWEYVFNDRTAGRKSKRSVEVTEVSGGAIHETISGDGLTAVSLAHAGGAYLVGPGMVQFSPYLQAFGELGPGRRFDSIATLRVADCEGVKECRVLPAAAVAERVTVAAGTVDALRIDIDIQITRASASGGAGSGRARLAYWFAPQARRIVKATGVSSGGAASMPDFAYELVSYKLN